MGSHMANNRRSARLRDLANSMLDRARSYPADHPERLALVRGARFLQSLARAAEMSGEGDNGSAPPGRRS